MKNDPTACLLSTPITGIHRYALEVEAGVKPLELRREELAIRQAAKIMSKENDTCINKAWNTYTESELMELKSHHLER